MEVFVTKPSYGRNSKQALGKNGMILIVRGLILAYDDDGYHAQARHT